MEIFSRLIALLLAIFLLPLFIIIFLLCLGFQGTPIFFKQKRVGYNYNIFEIYKYRTMVNNSGSIITKHNDNRVTIIGKILRKTKIDEIPQLYNIIKGDMRFIGPRPEVLDYFDKNKFDFLNLIKPGISDYSSIIFRNESIILEKIGGENAYSKLLPIKLELSKYYANKKSFFLDLKLVFITVIAIFFPNFCIKAMIIPEIKVNLPNVERFLNKYLFC